MWRRRCCAAPGALHGLHGTHTCKRAVQRFPATTRSGFAPRLTGQPVVGQWPGLGEVTHDAWALHHHQLAILRPGWRMQQGPITTTAHQYSGIRGRTLGRHVLLQTKLAGHRGPW